MCLSYSLMHNGKSYGVRAYVGYTTSKKHHDCASSHERRKKWFMIFFEVEPTDVETRSRPRGLGLCQGLGLGQPSSPRPKV